jgi:hypothetical protein
MSSDAGSVRWDSLQYGRQARAEDAGGGPLRKPVGALDPLCGDPLEEVVDRAVVNADAGARNPADPEVADEDSSLPSTHQDTRIACSPGRSCVQRRVQPALEFPMVKPNRLET